MEFKEKAYTKFKIYYNIILDWIKYNAMLNIFMVFAFAKTILLYSLTMESNFLYALMWTIPSIIALYGTAYMLCKKNVFNILLIFHTVISFILLGDLIYLKYFGTTPSIYDLSQLKELTGVGNSVLSMFSVGYLLMFVDIIFLLFVYDRKKAIVEINSKYKKVNICVYLIMFLSLVLNFILVKTDNNSYIFERYGIFNYHIKDMMFSTINADNYTFSDMSEKIEPETEQKEKNLFGIAKDRNVFLIQLEALQDFVIGYSYDEQEITPNLNKLIKENSIYFDRFYFLANKGMTSDSEFAALNSMYPVMEGPAYKLFENNTFYALPQALKDNGYKEAKAFHGYKPEFWNRSVIYPKLGFDQYISENDFDKGEIIGMGLSDEAFFKASVKYLKEMQQPYFSFLITLSSHNPFKIPEEHQKIKLEEKHKGTMFGDYLQAVHYLDYSLGVFFEELKTAGLYDNSIFLMYGDHFALQHKIQDNAKFMSEILGHEYNLDESMNVPFIIHIPGSNIAEKKSIVGSQLDIYPTILNLAGIERKSIKSRLFGQDLLNIDEGFVALVNFLNKGSFVDDNKLFLMPSNCKFGEGKAWGLNTKSPVELEQCEEGFKRAKEQIDMSNYILKNNLILEALKEDK